MSDPNKELVPAEDVQSNDPAAKVTLKHLTAYVLNQALIEIDNAMGDTIMENPDLYHRAWRASQECFWKGIEVGLRRAARGDELEKYLKELYETRSNLDSGRAGTARAGFGGGE